MSASASAVVRGSPTTITAKPPMTRYRVSQLLRNWNTNRQKESNSLSDNAVRLKFGLLSAQSEA